MSKLQSLFAGMLGITAIWLSGCTETPAPNSASTPLTLTSVTPKQGPATGGTLITLAGTSFEEGMTVTVGGATCSPVVLLATDKAQCTTSDHAVGKTDVTIAKPASNIATLLEAFTYVCFTGSVDGLAVWANDGADKITQDEQRASCDVIHQNNNVWDGSSISISGAKNEVVAFNLVIEASVADKKNVTVSFPQLTGPSGATISSVPTTRNGVFDWTQRNIELFYVRYLQITGLSQNSYNTYDERHIPKRFQRPWTGNGNTSSDGTGTGTWMDRPDHDKFYPDIAVPLELAPTFDIAAKTNQSIWTDIYIPKTAAAGTYTGTISVSVNGTVVRNITVALVVHKFALLDTPSSKTMLFLGYENISYRYFNVRTPYDDPVKGPLLDTIIDRHFQMARRHKISVIDSNLGYTIWSQQRPRPSWVNRLNGNIFKAAQGYNGPGVGLGNDIFSIGTYGSWSWQPEDKASMWSHTDAWEQWFVSNSPSTERFLFLIDESPKYAQTEMWASWMKTNPGVGRNLKSFATVPLPDAQSYIRDLDIAASRLTVNDTTTWQNAEDEVKRNSAKKFMVYNGYRPASGSFATEDDGVSLVELAWGQYKKGIDRWFFWHSTYYDDYQNQRGSAGLWHTDLFHDAQTFGKEPKFDPLYGMASDLHSNGDGVLFYPGTDLVFPNDSYGVQGPIASLRLKLWRRGIQDVDYITMAAKIDSVATQKIVDTAVPKVLWENGASQGNYIRTNISWSTNPDDWARYRAQLVKIIESTQK